MVMSSNQVKAIRTKSFNNVDPKVLFFKLKDVFNLFDKVV